MRRKPERERHKNGILVFGGAYWMDDYILRVVDEQHQIPRG